MSVYVLAQKQTDDKRFINNRFNCLASFYLNIVNFILFYVLSRMYLSSSHIRYTKSKSFCFIFGIKNCDC